jgi:hypothetical protein
MFCSAAFLRRSSRCISSADTGVITVSPAALISASLAKPFLTSLAIAAGVALAPSRFLAALVIRATSSFSTRPLWSVLSVVTGVTTAGGSVTVLKEYGGGIVAEFEASTPVVLGIQAARETPRYVPVAKVRRASKDATIQEVDAGDLGVDAGSTVSKMYKPDSGGGAEMLDGSAEEQASKIMDLLTQKGIK